ncbi:hypothetical protein ASD76_06300 [Altererythrobacter sp. Root672]|nr:hypothetical protein ASD76_06300 [Altererythrobacter sp. Root672]
MFTNDAYRRWLNLGFDAWVLGVEASTVIALRASKAAMGGDADGREARRMINEKVTAAIELQTAFLTGRLGTDPASATKRVVRKYTRKVRANRRRLS